MAAQQIISCVGAPWDVKSSLIASETVLKIVNVG